jgi:polyhydroxybutyrate depolymerase
VLGCSEVRGYLKTGRSWALLLSLGCSAPVKSNQSPVNARDTGALSGDTASDGAGTLPSSDTGDTGEPGDTAAQVCAGTDVLPEGLSELSIEQEIEGDWVSRRFLVHVGSGLSSSSCRPLMLAFHGNGGAPEDWVSVLQAGVDAGDFVGVYPEGHMRSWNTGHEASTADDIGFSEQVLSHLGSADGVDTWAPVAQGHSNGAGLVHLLAMESDRFAAVAALSSPLSSDRLPTEGDSQTSVMQLQGTADSSIPYGGGSDPGGVIEFLGAEESAAVWAAHNGCGAVPSTHSLDTRSTVLTWSACTRDIEVVHVRVDGGLHDLPDDIGGDTQAFIWRFLSAQRVDR